MARLETPLRTMLRFHSHQAATEPNRLPEPETVSINVEQRTMVWHALEPFEEGGYEPGPTLTATIQAGEPEAPVRELMERLLSALAFEFEFGIESGPYAASGGTNPSQRAIARTPMSSLGFIILPAPRAVAVETDDRLRLALALYRETLNSGSPFYRFLAAWNIFDAVCDENAHRDAFLNTEGPRIRTQLGITEPLDKALRARSVAEYLRDDARNAIAHVIRDLPSQTAIDPDLPQDRQRLATDSLLVQALAKAAIRRRWPDGVRVTPRLL